MLVNRSIPDSVVIPELAYRDVAEAVTWLCDAFGFAERLRIGNHRAQLSFGTGAIAVTERRLEQATDSADTTESPPGRVEVAHSVMVRVHDVDQHFERAVRHGARMLRPPTDYPFGERQCTVEDLGGHVWTFSETIADVDPETWGGTLPNRSGA